MAKSLDILLYTVMSLFSVVILLILCGSAILFSDSRLAERAIMQTLASVNHQAETSVMSQNSASEIHNTNNESLVYKNSTVGHLMSSVTDNQIALLSSSGPLKNKKLKNLRKSLKNLLKDLDDIYSVSSSEIITEKFAVESPELHRRVKRQLSDIRVNDLDNADVPVKEGNGRVKHVSFAARFLNNGERNFSAMMKYKMGMYDPVDPRTGLSSAESFLYLIQKQTSENKWEFVKRLPEGDVVDCSGCADTIMRISMSEEGNPIFSLTGTNSDNKPFFDSNCEATDAQDDKCDSLHHLDTNFRMVCTNHLLSEVTVKLNENLDLCSVDNYIIRKCQETVAKREVVNFVIIGNSMHLVKSHKTVMRLDVTDPESYSVKSGCSDCLTKSICKGDKFYKDNFNFPNGNIRDDCEVVLNKAKTKILIKDKAGRNQQVTCYGHAKLVVKRMATHVDSVPSMVKKDSITCSCEKGVISVLSSLLTIEQYKLCSGFKCFLDVVNSKKIEILLDNESLMRSTDHQLTLFFTNSISTKISVSCPYLSLCERIDCILCLVAIFNPSCYKPIHYVLLFFIAFSLLSFISLILYVLGKGTTAIQFAVFLIINIVNFIYILIKFSLRSVVKFSLVLVGKCRKVKSSMRKEMEDEENQLSLRETPLINNHVYNSTTESSFERPRRKRVLEMIGVIFIILSMIVCCVESCSEHQVLSSDDLICKTVMKDGSKTKECKVNKVVSIKLFPHSLDSCISIKSKTGLIVKTLRFGLIDVIQECQKSSRYYTFNAEPQITMQMHCPGVGFCEGDYCDKLSPTDKLPFESPFKENVGYVDCSKSCGSVFCGCFWPGDSCVVYKHFYTNPTQNTYEITTCSDWRSSFQLRLIIDENGKNSKTINERLFLGTNVELDDKLSASITGISNSEEIMTEKVFMKAPDSLYMCERINRIGTYNPDSFGFVQCNSEDNARTASSGCLTSISNFQSYVDSNEVYDRTPKFSYSSWLKDNCEGLPVGDSSFVYSWNDGAYERSVKDDRLYELTLNLDDYSVTILEDDATCVFKILELKGCFSCQTGSILEVLASSTVENTLVHVDCPSGAHGVFIVDSDAKKYKIHMMFNKPIIDEMCSFLCGSSRQEISLKGELHFVGFKKTLEYKSSEAASVIDHINNLYSAFMSTFSPFHSFIGYLSLIFVVPLVILSLNLLFKLLRNILNAVKMKTN